MQFDFSLAMCTTIACSRFLSPLNLNFDLSIKTGITNKIKITREDYSIEFKGKKALITDRSCGIGAAIAQCLIDGGATVIVTASSRHKQTPAGATFIKLI